MNFSFQYGTASAPKTKQEIAYHKLKEAILTLELEPNSALIEPEIMERFGLSRTPMREAIYMLQAEGLLTSIPNKGVYVNDIQYKDMMDIFETKEALESEAAYICCKRKKPENISKIEKAFNQYLDAANNNEHKLFMELDQQFHWAIAEACENQRIMHYEAQIQDQLKKFFNMTFNDALTIKFQKDSIEEHRKIYEAILGDDPDAARAAAIEHCQRTIITHVRDIYMF